MRFLPDRVTVTKIYMEVINANGKSIFPKETCLPEIDSDYYNPTFKFRRELRADFIDPTSLVLLTIVTKEKESGGSS